MKRKRRGKFSIFSKANKKVARLPRKEAQKTSRGKLFITNNFPSALCASTNGEKSKQKKKQNFHSGTLMAHKRLSSKQFPIQITEQEQQEISRFDREQKRRERKMGKLPTTYRQLVKWNSITLILRSARKKEWKITINLLMASLRWIIFDSILCSHKKWLIMDLLFFPFFFLCFFLIRQRSLLPSSVSILGSWAEPEPKLNEILWMRITLFSIVTTLLYLFRLYWKG